MISAHLNPRLHTLLAAAAISILGWALGAIPAHAERALLTTEAVNTEKVPGGGIEDACGVVTGPGGIFVSDYYRHAVDVFNSVGAYEGRIAGDPVDGPCGLASSSSGALYANDWHRGVERLLPTPLLFDRAESTGVATGPATGQVYADDRTSIAVYEPSGGPAVQRIGSGSLQDAYGVAVSAAGRVYVPDAASDTIEVYEPTVSVTVPAQVINGSALRLGRFTSLVDAAVAVDPTNEHLVVVDNLQPGYEHPEAAIDEFSASGVFLGQLTKKVVDAEPAGIAFEGGSLYVTSGNSEGAQVFKFGIYTGFDPMSAGAAALRPPTAAAPPPAPTAHSSAPVGPAIKVAAAGPGTLSARFEQAGTVALVGPGLVPMRVAVSPGSSVLHLHLNRAGRIALSRSKLHKLSIPVRVTFDADDGSAVASRAVVAFRPQKVPSRGR